jgi:hypothetical protein
VSSGLERGWRFDSSWAYLCGRHQSTTVTLRCSPVKSAFTRVLTRYGASLEGRRPGYRRTKQAAMTGAVHPSRPAKTRAPQDDGDSGSFLAALILHFLSRSSVEQSTALRQRGSRVRIAPGQPVRKVARGGTQPVLKTGPTSRSKVRLLHLPPPFASFSCHRSVKPASVKQAGRLTRGSNPRGRTNVFTEDSADVVDWFNAGAPLRRKEFDSPRPRQFTTTSLGS